MVVLGPILAFGAKPSHLRAKIDHFRTNKAIEERDMALWALNLDICQARQVQQFWQQTILDPSLAISITN